MRAIGMIIAVTVLITGCQLQRSVWHKYPIRVQCLEGCHTVVLSTPSLTAKQQQNILQFAKRYGAKQPILVSPCTQGSTRTSVTQVVNYLRQHRYALQRVRSTTPYHTMQHPCVNLVAGPLQVHPPKCSAYQLSSERDQTSFGCASQQWLARSITNPYDLLRDSGQSGQRP